MWGMWGKIVDCAAPSYVKPYPVEVAMESLRIEQGMMPALPDSPPRKALRPWLVSRLLVPHGPAEEGSVPLDPSVLVVSVPWRDVIRPGEPLSFLCQCFLVVS